MVLERALLLAISAAVFAGCSTTPDTPLITPSGCNPQLSLAAVEPTGVLEVRVVDGAGTPLAGETVQAWREVYTGAKCSSSIKGTTDAQGVVKFERLKLGPYGVVMPGGMSDRIQTEVKADQTTTITLVRTVASSPSPSP